MSKNLNSINHMICKRILLDYFLASSVMSLQNGVLDDDVLDIKNRTQCFFWITLDKSDYVFIRSCVFQHLGKQYFAHSTSPLLGRDHEVWDVLEEMTSDMNITLWRQNKIKLRLYQLEDIEFSVDISSFRKEVELGMGQAWEEPMEEYPFVPS